MNRSDFFKKIEDTILLAGVNELAIIKDCKYMTHNGRLVYIAINTDDKLHESKVICYYKEKDDNDKWRKIAVTKQIFDSIYDSVTSPYFFDFYAGVDSMHCEDCVLKVNANLGYLIIESPLYTLGRQLMSIKDLNIKTTLSSVTFDAERLQELRNIFKMQSHKLYQDLVYNKTQNRIIQKIYKRNSFYNIQKTFVPVFIEVEGIYNPLSDDITSTAYTNTNLYQLAVEKDRQLNVGDSIKCYMLTHLEICRAFGLSRFMRFTPDFVYKIFIGLLHPEYSDFPNKITKLYLAPNVEELPAELAKKYTPEAYQAKSFAIAKTLQNENGSYSENQVQLAQQQFKVIQMYTEVDTLRYACIQNRKALTTIGPSILDDSISERTLYNIISEAKI